MPTITTTSEIAAQAGAWLLTATAMLATTEMLHHQDHSVAPTTVGNGHIAQLAPETASVRAEGAKESARLPEEYDVGLRVPAISGS